MSNREKLFYQFFKSFSGLEARLTRCRDMHGLARLRMTPSTRGAIHYAERTESENYHVFIAPERFLNAVKHSLNSF